MSRMLLGVALAGATRSARAEPPPVRPAPGEELSAEDRALLEVIDLLWEMPLLEEWDPEEDAPDPILAEPPAPAPDAANPRAPKEARP